MKTKAQKKSKKVAKSPDNKFIEAQKYTDRGTIYDDNPNLDVPEFADEEATFLPDPAETDKNPLLKKDENENI
jgi:hypothetical protein